MPANVYETVVHIECILLDYIFTQKHVIWSYFAFTTPESMTNLMACMVTEISAILVATITFLQPLKLRTMSFISYP